MSIDDDWVTSTVEPISESGRTRPCLTINLTGEAKHLWRIQVWLTLGAEERLTGDPKCLWTISLSRTGTLTGKTELSLLRTIGHKMRCRSWRSCLHKDFLLSYWNVGSVSVIKWRTSTQRNLVELLDLPSDSQSKERVRANFKATEFFALGKGGRKDLDLPLFYFWSFSKCLCATFRWF